MSQPHPEDAVLVEVSSGHAPPEVADAVASHARTCASCAGKLHGFEVALTVAQAPAVPSAFEAATARRDFAATLGHEVRASRTAWRPSRVAAGLAIAAFSGAAAAMGVSAASDQWFSESKPKVATRVSTSELTAPAAVPPGLVEDALVVPSAPVEVPTVAPDLTKRRPRVRVRKPAPERKVVPQPIVKTIPAPAIETAPARGDEPRVALAAGARSAFEVAEAAEKNAAAQPPGDRAWVTAGDLFAQAGEADRAASSYANALAGRSASAARLRLGQVADADPSAARRLLTSMRASVGPKSTAEEMRLVCEWGLRYRGDRRSVEDCQNFARAHPGHKAMRTLALAAGQTAERRLNDCSTAITEYSRALILGENAGMTSAGALVARARCRAKEGDLAEARADLKLYLHMRPAAAYDETVEALAKKIGVALPYSEAP